jgi:hypothetical protein
VHLEMYYNHQLGSVVVDKSQNSNKNKSRRIADSWMDVNWRLTIDEVQPRNWCITTYGEDQCIDGDMQNVGSGKTIEGFQKCFCMDI